MHLYSSTGKLMKDQQKIRQQQAMMQSDNLEIEGWSLQDDGQYSMPMHNSGMTITLDKTNMQGSFAEDYNWTTEKTDVEQISDRLRTVEERLAILVPDPDKLEKWEALKEAYNHYKSLEALIGNPKEENEEER